MKMKSSPQLALTAFALLVASPSLALAHGNACKDDKTRFCSHLQQGDKSQMKQCLMDNYAQLSEECRQKMDKKMEKKGETQRSGGY